MTGALNSLLQRTRARHRTRRSNASRRPVSVPLVVLASLCVLLVCAAARAQQDASSGVSINDYRSRVRQAADSFEALARMTQEAQTKEGGTARAQLPATAARALGEARRLLPATMSVKLADGSLLEARNGWLQIELQAYEGLLKSGDNYHAQAERLEEMAVRLRALDARLGEYDGAAKEIAARDKDAEKGRLAAILRGPDFNKGGARGGAVNDLMERLQRWIESLFNRGRVSPSAGTGVSTAAQIVIFALALGVFGFVMWRFWLTRRGRLSRISLGREPRVILGEQIAPDETASDLLSAAEQLARAGDLRGAIRKAYVALLCELGDRNVIRLARHKTNRDYLQSVGQLAPHLYALMSPLTLDFERHWYGLERATEDDWRDFLTGCRRTLDAK